MLWTRGAGALVGILLATVGVGVAGSLDSPAAPDDPASAMPTLEDLYNRLASGAAYVLRTTFVEPTAGPGATGHTLQQVMNAAPAADNTAGAVPSQVLAGKTYWGLRTDGGGWGEQTGTGTLATGPPAPVGETGQVTCYDEAGTLIACPGTGQDGDRRPGVSWPVPRFTDNGDGTVTDNLTGLVWLKDASCYGVTFFAGALAWCSWLYDGCVGCGGTNNDCGLSDGSVAGDWRLPTVNEMLSLFDCEYINPALSNAAGTAQWSEGDPFSGVESGYYWSSTSFRQSPYSAWSPNTYYGDSTPQGKTGYQYIWPVRAGG